MSWLDRFRNRKAEKHENRLLFYRQDELQNEYYAVVRISWFNDGKVCGVTESKIDTYDADVVMEFSDIVGNALRAGADVSVVCIDDPENLGIHAT
jgi:uroporphyrinogen-III decarboxylase